MGRGQVRNSSDPGTPSGPAWTAFRKRLFGGPWLGRPCAACGHPIAPGMGEIQHQLSVSTRPDLAWSVTWRGDPQLVPVHGGGKRRCPEPACNLACNAILAGNACPRDELGRPVLPFPPAFLAAKVAERQRYRARSLPDGRKPGQVPGNPAHERPRPRTFPLAGRAW